MADLQNPTPATPSVSVESEEYVLVRSAYRAVRTAIEQGRLKRASFCARCGAADRPGSDGRSTIHAHHLAGYDNPLCVEWLCAACHRAETPLPEVMGAPVCGERNGFAKVSDEAAAEIANSNEPSSQLALRYGVSRWTVARIRSGKRSSPNVGGVL